MDGAHVAVLDHFRTGWRKSWDFLAMSEFPGELLGVGIPQGAMDVRIRDQDARGDSAKPTVNSIGALLGDERVQF